MLATGGGRGSPQWMCPDAVCAQAQPAESQSLRRWEMDLSGEDDP